MAIQKFVISTVASTGSPLNPAENVFHFANTTLTASEIAAQLIGFVTTAMDHVSSHYSVVDVKYGPLGGPLISLPFPATELAAANAAVGVTYESPCTDYGDELGNTAEACPPGASTLMTEFTALGGRHNGRKYLAWLCTIGTTNEGLITSAAQNGIAARYKVWIQGTDPVLGGPIGAPVEDLAPVAGAANSPISGVKVSLNPARLRTRIR